jgi:hypothetical protein
MEISTYLRIAPASEQVPFFVIVAHVQASQNQTLIGATRMSANCQKQTYGYNT